jgi:hypothetical protein
MRARTGFNLFQQEAMKSYVYIIEKNRVHFYVKTEDGKTHWSPNPDHAHSFSQQWVPAEPTPEMPNRKERFANMAEEFATENGARYCVGDPNDMVKLHEAGPQIGQRVLIKGQRSDGFVYGTGYVCDYARILPHFLSHTVMLDNPPKSGAPDEFGKVYTTDPEALCRHHCPVYEMERL